MKYFSTRGEGIGKRSAEAIIAGLASDKGLYIPESMPALDLDLEKLPSLDYQTIATHVISSFFDDFTDEEIKHCVDQAYDSKFTSPKITPLVKAGNLFFLELYRGQTSAFKDIALSILPYLLTTALKKENEDKEIVILTATSGDTGKAALAGFAGVPGTRIIVFYPQGGVSKIQERQMVTQAEPNTYVFAIDGNFDDAQRGVKEIFKDEALAKTIDAKGFRFSSANSINIGRLIPQVVYYMSAYAQLIDDRRIQAGDKINVCVPTGNFGNILAAYYAKEMGLPIARIICASNSNNVLTDFIRTGTYDANREFYQTSSPSMDILISSNLERLLYHLSGGDTQEVANYMKDLEESGRYKVSNDIFRKLSEFSAYYADETQVADEIRRLYYNHEYLCDTHTAVAAAAYQQYKSETNDETRTIVASTASPYKFTGAVASALGLRVSGDDFRDMQALLDKTDVDIPSGLKDLKYQKVIHHRKIEKGDMREAIIDVLEEGKSRLEREYV